MRADPTRGPVRFNIKPPDRGNRQAAVRSVAPGIGYQPWTVASHAGGGEARPAWRSRLSERARSDSLLLCRREQLRDEVVAEGIVLRRGAHGQCEVPGL